MEYLLNVNNVLSNYAKSIPLHDKIGKAIVENWEATSKKPRNMWVDGVGEFNNRTMDHWLKEIIFASIRHTNRVS